jgi:hypothetical protein
MSSHPPAETIEAHGCSVVLRRMNGPTARELFISCQPPAGTMDAGEQAGAIYRALLDVLEAEGETSNPCAGRAIGFSLRKRGTP